MAKEEIPNRLVVKSQPGLVIYSDREDKVIFDRELFYAMQTRERLAEMIERYQRAFA